MRQSESVSVRQCVCETASEVSRLVTLCGLKLSNSKSKSKSKSKSECRNSVQSSQSAQSFLQVSSHLFWAWLLWAVSCLMVSVSCLHSE